MKDRKPLHGIMLQAGDIILAAAAVFLSYCLSSCMLDGSVIVNSEHEFLSVPGSYLLYLLLMTFLQVIVLHINGVYRRSFGLLRIEELAWILKSTTTSVIIILLLSFIPAIPELPSVMIIMILPLSFIMLSTWHRFYRHFTEKTGLSTSIEEYSTLESVPPSLTGYKRILKRMMDLVLTVLLLLMLFPFCLICLVLIVLESGLPVVYVQARLGKDNKPFHMFKFRSMERCAHPRKKMISYLNEASFPLYKVRGDPRTTLVGRFMRRWSLDEMPQLINVIAGRMSLVGPRPPLQDEVEEYSKCAMKRMKVLPGMTGAWQVLGRSDLTFSEMIALDLYYVYNWSIWIDMVIILLTPEAVLLGRGAY
ncbi:MAG: sugar transferase [Candidatus Aegiribacteria sp.]|nr:sugar transferase [Candidatus Aegiribacteria sp.]